MQQVRGRGNLQAGGDIFFNHNDFNEERRTRANIENRHTRLIMRIQALQVTLLILMLLLTVTSFVRHSSLQEEVKELKSMAVHLLNRHPDHSPYIK